MSHSRPFPTLQQPSEVAGDTYRAVWRVGQLFHTVLSGPRFRGSFRTRLDRPCVDRGTLSKCIFKKSTGRRKPAGLSKTVQPKKKVQRQPQHRQISHFIQCKIYDFMLKYTKGIPLDQFDSAYNRKFNQRLVPQLQGFTSMRGLLEACVDIVKVQDGHVYPVQTNGAHNRYSTKTTPYLTTTSQFLNDNKVLNPVGQKKTEIPSDLKNQILSVLLKRSNGIFAARFPFEYKALHKKEFDVQSLGFTSVVELMAEIPDIVKVTRPTERGDFVLVVSEVKAPPSPKKPEQPIEYITKNPGTCGDKVTICVSFIIDPSLFYVQLCSGLDDLYDLMEAMTTDYETNHKEAPLPPQSLVENQTCAALYEDQWYRAVIAEVLSDTKVHTSLLIILQQ